MMAMMMVTWALAPDVSAVPVTATPTTIGARLYASCAGCHGTAGAGTGQAVPLLAGQPQQALVASMRAFKDGTRAATIMQQIVKGYTDQELELIAAYLAAQKPKGQP